MPKVKSFTRVRDAEHIISEAEGRRSREQIMLAAAAFTGVDHLKPGTVLGQITATKLYVPHDPAAATGAEVAKAFLYARAEPNAAANVRAVAHVRDCEVNGKKLFWKAGITGPQKATAEAALATNGALVRY